MMVDYLLTSLIIILLPGTGVIYTLTVGLKEGVWLSIYAAFGCTLGIVPHLAASLTGVAAILHTSALAFSVLKWIGVAYLFYMAWVTLNDKSNMALDDDHALSKRGALSAVKRGVLLNILNPKLSLFFVAFLPQFVPVEEANPTWRMLVLAVIFMILTFIIFVGYGIFASSARRYVVERPRVLIWFRRLFAGTFGLLGVKLAVD